MSMVPSLSTSTAPTTMGSAIPSPSSSKFTVVLVMR
ncbi:hypothetical protein RB2654_15205 [Rhodobacterales bacterium HTCC2654]|uniref:Uncharacterized protein n=1 Tax=Maritimibacter alkaliphilus HTCC2654 TaxID=314271 RepID=A3VH90_9RHOB|nr:hypothetical protein RB2654_15205 [Rhodobacterales bacterium HTCC2654] [Maritimibacter alkaliphilus HTCC2654]